MLTICQLPVEVPSGSTSYSAFTLALGHGTVRHGTARYNIDMRLHRKNCNRAGKLNNRNVSSRDLFKDSDEMEVAFSATCSAMRVSEGDQFEEQYQRLRILLSRRRRVVRRKRLEARRRYVRLMMVLSMAVMATFVPQPRVQWTLQRYWI